MKGMQVGGITDMASPLSPPPAQAHTAERHGGGPPQASAVSPIMKTMIWCKAITAQLLATLSFHTFNMKMNWSISMRLSSTYRSEEEVIYRGSHDSHLSDAFSSRCQNSTDIICRPDAGAELRLNMQLMSKTRG